MGLMGEVEAAVGSAGALPGTVDAPIQQAKQPEEEGKKKKQPRSLMRVRYTDAGKAVRCFLSTGLMRAAWVRLSQQSSLRISTRLSKAHFERNAFSRMNVAIAAQVSQPFPYLHFRRTANTIRVMHRPFPIPQLLSGSMAALLRADQFAWMNEPMAELCDQVNRWWDLMNGRGGRMINHTNDPLLEELMGIYEWFHTWEEETKLEPHHFLGAQCWYDLRLAILGFVAFCRDFLGRYPTCYVSPRATSQDPVEHHFGHQREACGDNDNPNTTQAFAGSHRSFVYRWHTDKKSNSGGAGIMVNTSRELFKGRERPQ